MNALKQPRNIMSEATLHIKPWGNNLGVRLPAAVARAAQLHANQRVHITVEGGRVIITPLRDQPATLADRLARFDPAVHGGEAMAAAPVGRETW
jgi:antitoxin MazE